MRICFLEGDMSRTGGTERMTAWLANSLCTEHDINILSLRMKGENPFFSLNVGVGHSVLPAFDGKSGILKQIHWIHQFILDNHIDWILNVDVGMGFYGILAAKGTSARTITWEHGNYYNNWGSKLFPYMRRYAAKKSDVMVVLTEKDQKNYSQHIRGLTEIHTIPNPAARHQCRYHADNRMILSVGHLLENKGYHRAIEMAANILPQHPEWQWVICGEGPERRRLEEMIHHYDLESQVKLPGLIKDMDEMYAKAAMLVMTSEMEGLPMVLLEAKSHGIPLVAFDIMTGPSDIIEDGVNGCLITPFDQSAMGKAIEDLMVNEHLRGEMSAKADRGMEKFSEKHILDIWKRILER